MHPKQILTEARDLLSQPERWTQGAFAVDITGEAVGSNSPTACSWCSVGAINKTTPNVYGRLQARLYLEQAIRHIYKVDALIEAFNDQKGRTHAEVLTVFDEAIRSANA